MFDVDADFIGNFKLGDNLNYNLSVLGYLYELQAQPENEAADLLRKPIIVLLGSIAEALLYDLHKRVKDYTIEGVPGLPAAVVAYIRGKQIDKFEVFITSAAKHEILGQKKDPIYSDLQELRKLRNRIHIQNQKHHFEPDESTAFSGARQEQAERTVENLAKTISKNHPRKQKARGYVGTFRLPWIPHLPSAGVTK